MEEESLCWWPKTGQWAWSPAENLRICQRSTERCSKKSAKGVTTLQGALAKGNKEISQRLSEQGKGGINENRLQRNKCCCSLVPLCRVSHCDWAEVAGLVARATADVVAQLIETPPRRLA